MILQTDPRLLPEIQKYGCYYMSICYLLNKHHKTRWDTDKINEFYKAMVHLGYIGADDDFTTADSDDGLILYPDKIFASEGLKVHYFGHSKPVHACRPDEIEILKFVYRGGAHFVAGNGEGVPTYDPWGVSQTVRYGELDSKRIFRLI